MVAGRDGRKLWNAADRIAEQLPWNSPSRETSPVLVANVIFHAFQAAYLSWLFLAPLALAVLVAEGGILLFFTRGATLQAIMVSVVGMNLASYVVGLALSPQLYVDSRLVVVDPDEQGHGILARGPPWERLARYRFLQAGIVRAVVEAIA